MENISIHEISKKFVENIGIENIQVFDWTLDDPFNDPDMLQNNLCETEDDFVEAVRLQILKGRLGDLREVIEYCLMEGNVYDETATLELYHVLCGVEA